VLVSKSGTVAFSGTHGRAACVLRVGAYVAIVSAGLALVTLRSVYAEMRESSLHAGRNLWQLREVLGDSTKLSVNGTSFEAGRHYVESDVKTVLDRIEQHCVDAGWRLDREALNHPTVTARGPSRASKWGSLRSEDDGEGVAPEAEKGVASLLQRVSRFQETHDLGALGELRFVYARRAEGRTGSDVLFVLSIGSSEPTSPGSSGDVPGGDLPGIPRPQGSVRILAAEVAGGQYGLHSYVVSDSPADVLRFYESTLFRLGWSLVPISEASGAPAKGLEPARVVTKDGAALLVLTDDADRGRTRVDLVHFGSAGVVRFP